MRQNSGESISTPKKPKPKKRPASKPKRMAVKFDKPPVRVTANGSLSIAADDIFHSRVGQEVILKMAELPRWKPRIKI